MPTGKIEADLEKVLLNMDKEYATGSRSWFDNLDDKVVVYSQNSAEPFQSRKSYENYFEKALTGSKRKLNILSRQIRNIGETSIVSQTVQIIQDEVIVNIKQSQVWSMTKEGWKINHLHSTFANTPNVTGALAKRVKGLNVLNEKIATIATAVGVAQ